MAQNDMRVLKDPAKIHEIAQEYLSKLSVNQTPGLMTGRMQQVGDNTFDITELVKKGRALRGVK
jgi:Tfp pilus assembly protein PilP